LRLPERDQAVVAHKKRPPEGSPCDHHRDQRRSTTATSSGVVSFNTRIGDSDPLIVGPAATVHETGENPGRAFPAL
jgi:hypothetical protein